MKTEIEKVFRHGFVLSEQEFRRLALVLSEHAAKLLNPVPHSQFSAALQDGTRIESNNVDDILSIENHGAKTIIGITIIVKPTEENPDWRIAVRYVKPKVDVIFSEPSVEYTIYGPSRDWVFVASADLEDRIKRNKKIAWEVVFSGPYGIIISLVLPVTVAIVGMSIILGRQSSGYQNLKNKIDSGEISDPLQGLLEVEKYRSFEMSLPGPSILWIAVLTMIVLGAMAKRISSVISPSYNFLWGDYIPIFNRKKNIRNVLWTVVILGTIVSVVSTIISKKMGF